MFRRFFTIASFILFLASTGWGADKHPDSVIDRALSVIPAGGEIPANAIEVVSDFKVRFPGENKATYDALTKMVGFSLGNTRKVYINAQSEPYRLAVLMLPQDSPGIYILASILVHEYFFPNHEKLGQEADALKMELQVFQTFVEAGKLKPFEHYYGPNRTPLSFKAKSYMDQLRESIEKAEKAKAIQLTKK